MTKQAPAPSPPPRKSRRALGCAVSVLSLLLSLGAAEVLFRVLEQRDSALNVNEGDGAWWIDDPRWGWKPNRGTFRRKTSEFDVRGTVNSVFMNDSEPSPEDAGKFRVLALGDSHTFAVGVSPEESWPAVLGRRLSERGTPARVYNAGCTGYSLHQYLLRLRDQGPSLKPDLVVVGLSLATDLYDLLPPDRGGWVYGGNRSRHYFDLGEGGLVERIYLKPEPAEPGTVAPARSAAQRVRGALDSLALFRRLRRSSLALFVGSRVTVGGRSLWPNMDVVLEKEVSPANKYAWELAEALLAELKEEADRQGAGLRVVLIPYLPQVYDEIWDVTFAREPRFERDAAARRLLDFAAARGIAMLDLTPAMREAVKTRKRWIHFRLDAHPTPEGHAVMADAIESWLERLRAERHERE